MPNGVDTEAFSPGPDADGLRASLGIPDDAIVAAFVATLDRAHHFKRLDVAIEALARWPTTSGCTCSSPATASCGLSSRRRRATAGLAERVHFLGRVPHAELPGVLRAADLFLLTTEPPESFGIVLIEAMACGLPVIATEYPGVRAVVDDDVKRRRRPARRCGCGRRRARRGSPRRAPRSAAPRRGRPRQVRARVELAAAARPDGRGLPRRDRDAAGAEPMMEPGPLDPPRRLLLSALARHRRAPAGVDGSAPAPARPPGHGAHHRRLWAAPRRRRAAVRRPERRRRPRRRPAAREGTPAGPRPRRLAVRLRHLLRAPPSAQQADRPRAARARLGAVRDPRSAAPSPRARLRLRDHDLAARSRPTSSAAPCSARRPPGSPTCATPGPSSPFGPQFPTAAPAPRRRAAGAPPALVRRRGRLRQPSRRRRPRATAGSPKRS